MSSISSQLLVTSSSLTKDFYQIFLRKHASEKESLIVGRASVALVAAIAIALAYDRESTILSLVSNAWAGFGAAFGPLVIFSLLSRKMTATSALVGMVTGAATVLLWIYLPITINGQSLSGFIYEIVPGFIASSLAIMVCNSLISPPEHITKKFDQYRTALKSLN